MIGSLICRCSNMPVNGLTDRLEMPHPIIQTLLLLPTHHKYINTQHSTPSRCTLHTNVYGIHYLYINAFNICILQVTRKYQPHTSSPSPSVASLLPILLMVIRAQPPSPKSTGNVVIFCFNHGYTTQIF